jgi:hypothetical protein
MSEPKANNRMVSRSEGYRLAAVADSMTTSLNTTYNP